ncbi:alpha/beta hydrolase family protein [Streptomyces polyrhachis]|uniref:Alpha/beta hydrolase family protein n=1 Tax=Streptomyces polyrhachis TaxID=1282885 RepID=A0ABW2GBP9_9ACTN
MRRTRVCAAAVVSTAVLIALTGCGGDSGSPSGSTGGSTDNAAPASTTPEPAPESSGPNDLGCLEADQLAGSTTLALPDGMETDAYLTGKGPVGVIFSHQVNLNACSWVPLADQLAADGYQALAINSLSTEVDELVAGAKLLREKGAKKIVLIGASKGGTGSLAAAAVIEPPVSAVVSLSGPAEFGDLDALAAVARLTMPVYLVVGRNDSRFFEDAEKLKKAATHSRDLKYEVIEGAEHGNSLLDEYPKTWESVRAFIKKSAG